MSAYYFVDRKAEAMNSRVRRLPSPALVISLIALFVALGGTVYAASQINGKQIKKNSIPGNRVKKNTLTGGQIKESSLGTVPSANKANTASTATNADTASKADSATKADTAAKATNADNATNAANANALDGLSSAAFEPKSRWAVVDATGATGTASIVAQSGGISVASDIGTYTYLDFGSSQANTHILTAYGRLTSDEAPLTTGVCGGSGSGPSGVTCVVPGTNNANHIVVHHNESALYYIVVSPN